MSEYTPTRQELIASWIQAHREAGCGGPVDVDGRPKERIAEAHRGLAEVERAVAEKEWDEGKGSARCEPNPLTGSSGLRSAPTRTDETKERTMATGLDFY